MHSGAFEREFKRRRARLIFALLAAIALLSQIAEASGGASGQRRSGGSLAPSPNRVTVIQVDGRLPTAELKKAGFEVKTAEQFHATDPWRDPSPSLRNRIFDQAGLSKALRSWDEFDRDMLFLRAQEQTPAALAKKYPSLPRAALTQLHRVISREKGVRS